jgi:hypothetical protein
MIEDRALARLSRLVMFLPLLMALGPVVIGVATPNVLNAAITSISGLRSVVP